ncbi:MAG: ABC transporter ATP-binding protein [Syntrophales bacterium]|nr:ABC transporter ATP-binding protein [Syntrophales bacterium]MDY0045350.1 ABC transporter ATP-binding protein [Syntrophales bacterium]
MLKVEEINVSYGPVQVLERVGFSVGEGECVALLGSNGAGKTTALKAISGLLQVGSGSISFLNNSINHLKPGERVRAGLIQVPEGGSVFPYMTVWENLLMGASGQKEAWKIRNRSADRVTRMFPILKDRKNSQARLLSGGERQMLVLARGLMALPKLLMVDEPSLGLAPKILLEIFNALRILRKEGVTILLAEQNVQLALQLADRGYVLENGKVVMENSSRELLESDHIRKAYLGL